MDATTTFVADVTVALIGGSIAGAVARALRITPIIGYLLAGVVIGPFTPGYVAHGSSLSGLAELGLIFLLFSLGLGFSLSDLSEAGIVAIAGNVLAMGATAAAIWFAASKLGMVHPLTLALAFTVSSTAVGAALLQALGVLDLRAGRIGLSLLIAQDLLAVMVLVIISTPANALLLAGIGVPLVRAVVFVVVALILGATLLHKLYVFTLQRASSDLRVVIFSAVALAAAWIGRGLLWTAAGRSVKLGTRSALALGISLLPMGEFNIVLGNASFAAGRLNRVEMALLISTSVFSIAIAALVARALEGSDLRAERVRA